MAKIPFDIKYRPQIESGEYKVVYVENSSMEQHPVEILKWDSNSDAGCIIGCIRFNGKDRVYAFGENGEHKVSGGDNQLFLITPEPEMSEFEKAIKDLVLAIDEGELQELSVFEEENLGAWAIKQAGELLALAKQQLLQSGELLTQEHHEKLMETQYNETLEGVKKNWRNYFTPQTVTDIYNAGRNDVLKGLPRWKKWGSGACCGGQGIPLAIVKRGLNGYELVDSLSIPGEQYIMLYDLEKLPGFKEDEK